MIPATGQEDPGLGGRIESYSGRFGPDAATNPRPSLFSLLGSIAAQRRKSGHSTNLSGALSGSRNLPAPHAPWHGAKFRVSVLAGFLPHTHRPRLWARSGAVFGGSSGDQCSWAIRPQIDDLHTVPLAPVPILDLRFHSETPTPPSCDGGRLTRSIMVKRRATGTLSRGF